MNTSFFQKIGNYIKTHRFTSFILALIIIVGGYLIIHAATKKVPPSTYLIGTVQQGTIVSTITGTGQISTSQSVALQPQVSGNLTNIYVKAGQSVNQGQPLFSIDATDAARAVQTDKDNLAAAELDLRSTETQNTNSTTDESKAVADAYNTLLSADLQAQANDLTTANYQAPTISGNYTLGQQGTLTVSTYASEGGISYQVTGLTTGYGLVSSISPQPLGNSGLFILFPQNVKGGLNWNIVVPNKNGSSYIANEEAYQTALENQSENNDPNGTPAVTLAQKQLAVQEAQDTLTTAEETLADYTVTAPFNGTIASIPVSIGDQVSSGTTLGTIIDDQELATLSLNEVEVSKVQVGDKATLTFDAINGLSVAGTVATINPVGTVTSGVVNYTVTINLDTQDPRVLSGMSVTAAIQTAVAENVLEIPNSAVKTSNNGSYVMLVPSDTPLTTGTTGITLTTTPTITPVQVGITDGVNTEITSGLQQGDEVVIKTIAANTTTATTTTTSAPSLLGGGGARGFGGGGAGVVRGG